MDESDKDDGHLPSVEYSYREHTVRVEDGEGTETVEVPEFAFSINVDRETDPDIARVSYLVPVNVENTYISGLDDMMEGLERLVGDMAPDGESAGDQFRVDDPEDL